MRAARTPGKARRSRLRMQCILPKSCATWGRTTRRLFARFERDRKPRVERIVAAGRRAASDKTIVSPLQSRIRNVMIGLILRLFGIPGQDRAFRYRIQWD